MPPERLQKILARVGVASRRAAEALITAGRVAVDGRVVTELGSKADPLTQKVSLDGQVLGGAQTADYWLVHKPAGVVSTVSDPQGRPRVIDLLPTGAAGRVYPVGRLDLDSEGLVLLTNDGELAYRLMHPRFMVPKLYRVWVAGRPGGEALERLRQGVRVEGRLTAPARVQLKGGTALRSKLSMVIYEGRKREIRLMCAAVGHPVQRLVRMGLGPIKLGELPVGAARRLSGAEVAALKAAAGLAQAGPAKAAPGSACQGRAPAQGSCATGAEQGRRGRRTGRPPDRGKSGVSDAGRGSKPRGRPPGGKGSAGPTGRSSSSRSSTSREPGGRPSGGRPGR